MRSSRTASRRDDAAGLNATRREGRGTRPRPSRRTAAAPGGMPWPGRPAASTLGCFPEEPPAVDDATQQETKPGTPPLDAVEARVLGCLVEKAATTPEAYPLTLNALVAACNQKTSREPVMDLDPGEVGHALNALERRGLVKIAPASQRALRYEHRFDAIYGT